MRVAIVQPHYLPWAGYFSLMAASDVLVLLDSVAISKQSWQTRNRVQLPDGRVVWLSIPVKSSLGQRLDTVEIDDSRGTYASQGWRRKHWATIRACYEKAPFWDEISWLEECYMPPDLRLAQFTGWVIVRIVNHLGLSTRVVQASKHLPSMPDGKTERLAAILEHLGATEYLTTRGAVYLKGRTHVGNARIRWHDWSPVFEPEGRNPYLSIVDSLAWNGVAKTAETLRAPSDTTVYS